MWVTWFKREMRIFIFEDILKHSATNLKALLHSRKCLDFTFGGIWAFWTFSFWNLPPNNAKFKHCYVCVRYLASVILESDTFAESYDEVELLWLFWLDCCFSWRMTDLILPTSLTFLDTLGLNSQSEATRSHSVPGAILSVDFRISISEVWDADRLDCWSLAS